MQEHIDKIDFAIQAAWIIGPVLVVLTAARVAYLRNAGLRTTGMAVSSRRETRTRTRNDSDGRSRWETYYVWVTDVSYTDRAGNRHHCTVDGRYGQGDHVPLVFTARSPHRAKHASAASFSRVLAAIAVVIVVIIALSYMRDQAVQDVERFCGGLDAAARDFHDC